MIHDEVEQLLGAYALHATDDRETRAVEAHLAECPRCRAEVDAHEETAAMLATSAGEPPPGLWDKIAASIEAPPGWAGPTVLPPVLPATGGGPVPPGTGPDGRNEDPSVAVPLVSGRRRGSRGGFAWGLVAAAAAAAAIFLGVQVSQLRSDVTQVRAAMARQGLGLLAAQAQAGPHRTLTLGSTAHGAVATVVVPVGSEDAYWVGSTLSTLASSRTYQLWGLVRGKPVSLGVMGPDPRAVSTFRLEPDVTKLMVTAEPRGGTSLPTTAVLAVGDVGPGHPVS